MYIGLTSTRLNVLLQSSRVVPTKNMSEEKNVHPGQKSRFDLELRWHDRTICSEGEHTPSYGPPSHRRRDVLDVNVLVHE